MLIRIDSFVTNQLGFMDTLTTDHGIRSYKDISDMRMMPRVNVDKNINVESFLQSLEVM